MSDRRPAPGQIAATERGYGGLVYFYLVACVLLGGASAEGVFVNLVLQLGALALLTLAARRLARISFDRRAYVSLGLLAAILLLPLIQLVPLDPSIWTQLGGRAPIADGYEMLGMDLPWEGISLAPRATFGAWLALLPGAALFLAALTLEHEERRLLPWVILGLAGGSLALGLLQLMAPQSPTLYLYHSTNRGSAVGFFSNRNHLATLLLIAIPATTALLTSSAQKRPDARSILGRRLTLAAVLLTLAVGLLMTGSRAGIGLALPALILTALLVIRLRTGQAPWVAIAGALVLSAAILTIVLFSPWTDQVAHKANRGFEQDARVLAAPITLAQGVAYAPFGTGFGTFDGVFRMDASDINLREAFMNHAHNDYLETWLTGGVPGVALILAFLVWFGAVAISNWRARSRDVGAMARLAIVGIGLVLLHSLVDYPLRTAALSGLFGLLCGLQLPVPTNRGVKALAFAGERPVKTVTIM